MRNFKVRWTQDGEQRTSVVSYSDRCAQEEVDDKHRQGFADAEMFEVSPRTGEEIRR